MRSVKHMKKKIKNKLFFYLRFFDKFATKSFANTINMNIINEIYVINLDRSLDRWASICKELKRIPMTGGGCLYDLCKRYSAVDARFVEEKMNDENLISTYRLRDQLFVDPDKRLSQNSELYLKKIFMTPQEIAIALSHINVWKLIVNSNVPYALILEDDVFFQFGFAKSMDKTWDILMQKRKSEKEFDLFYLSYVEVGRESKEKDTFQKPVRRPDTGIWQTSGYILSRSGAKKLLDLLPMYGPVDIWLNLNFDKLNTYIINTPIVYQRNDFPSTNAYSIVQALSQVDK